MELINVGTDRAMSPLSALEAAAVFISRSGDERLTNQFLSALAFTEHALGSESPVDTRYLRHFGQKGLKLAYKGSSVVPLEDSAITYEDFLKETRG